jgi:hypothetical protein
MDPAALAQRIAEMQAELTRMSARVTELLAAQATAVPAHGADALTAGLTVFVLACFVGYYVVWNVTPALHSPLMSVTNAISSVIIVGAILAAGLSTVGFSGGHGFPRGGARLGQHLRRLRRHATHAQQVPQEREGEAMSGTLSTLLYLASAILFILALRGLSSPDTARQGNAFGIAGMTIAIVTTLVQPGMGGWWLIILGIAIGGAIGTYIALKIEMTALPQLVAAFHSLVGLAAVFVAAAALYSPQSFGIGIPGAIQSSSLIEMSLGVAIGAITFTGSIIAFAKLQALMTGAPLVLPLPASHQRRPRRADRRADRRLRLDRQPDPVSGFSSLRRLPSACC